MLELILRPLVLSPLNGLTQTHQPGRLLLETVKELTLHLLFTLLMKELLLTVLHANSYVLITFQNVKGLSLLHRLWPAKLILKSMKWMEMAQWELSAHSEKRTSSNLSLNKQVNALESILN